MQCLCSSQRQGPGDPRPRSVFFPLRLAWLRQKRGVGPGCEGEEWMGFLELPCWGTRLEGSEQQPFPSLVTLEARHWRLSTGKGLFFLSLKALEGPLPFLVPEFWRVPPAFGTVQLAAFSPHAHIVHGSVPLPAHSTRRVPQCNTFCL